MTRIPFPGSVAARVSDGRPLWAHPRGRLALAVLAIGAILGHAAVTGSARADDPEPETEGDWPTLSFTLENDLFGGTDQYYTNGVRIGWTSGQDQVPDRLKQVAAPLMGGYGATRWHLGLGQNLYTPDDLTRDPPDPEDRPYAAWLYGSIGLVNDTGEALTSAMLFLGTTGEPALGEPTQDFVHDVIGSTDPQGWDSQLGAEPTVMLLYERKWTSRALGDYRGFAFDAQPHVTGALGNVFTYAGAGLTLRAGADLPRDYGPPRIQPQTPGSDFFVPVDDFGWYLFAGVEGRAVAHNMFLDGNTFEDSPSVDRNVLVGDVSVGAVMTLGDTRISYTQVFRSAEFEGQDGMSTFGAVGLSWRF